MRVAALIVILAQVASTKQAAQFQTEVALVNVTCSVRSADGRFITGLDRGDFEVLEDGVVQKIQFFAQPSELPLSIGLIVDASGSQSRFTSRHGRDVQTFLESVLRPADRAFALCFGNHLRLVSDFTSSPEEIIQGLERFEHGSWHGMPEVGPLIDRDLGTALYDAVYEPVKEKMANAEQRRRALIVFSDGEENASEHDLLDAIRAAQNADTVLFGIRYTMVKHNRMNARNKYGIRAMDHLALETGGETFDGLTTDLPGAFRQIDAQIRSMYELGFASTNPARDGTFRKLTIRVKQPGLSIRAKTGYYAAN